MPSQKQIAVVVDQIRDVIGRNYIESDGDECSCWFQPEGGGPVGRALFMGAVDGTPEPFIDLPTKAQVELLVTCVGWEGFSPLERTLVQQRVLDGQDSEYWMAGIDATRDHERGREQFRQILAGDSFQKYGTHLNEASERALDRMQGKEGREL
jgi:hypothetical protein